MHKRGRDLVSFFGLPKARKVAGKEDKDGSGNQPAGTKAALGQKASERKTAESDVHSDGNPKESASKHNFLPEPAKRVPALAHIHEGSCAQFLPSQHPADAPRVEYFSGEKCSGDQHTPDLEHAANGSEVDPEQGVACVPSKSLAPQQHPSDAPNPQSLSSMPNKPDSIASVQVGVRGSTGADSEGADGSLTEARTPTLETTATHSKVVTLLTIAASTQSPRNKSPVPQLCKHDAAGAGQKDQDVSPGSDGAAAVLAPPTLLTEQSDVHYLKASAGKVPLCGMHSTSQPVQVAAVATDATKAQEPGEPHSSYSNSMQTSGAETGSKTCSMGTASDAGAVPVASVAVPASCTVDAMHEAGGNASAAITGSTAARGEHHAVPAAASSDDDDDLLFDVNLTNLGSASAAVTCNLPQANRLLATNSVAASSSASASVPQNAACLTTVDVGKHPAAEGYNAAAEAVVPQSRLQHASEEQFVKGLVSWGQCEKGLTLTQQREVDRHIVQQVEARSAWESTLVVKHAASNSQRWVHLHGGWIDAPIQPGDAVNVIVVNSAHNWCLAPDGQLHITVAMDGAVLLILHPDMLLSSTSIASALECPREAMLKERGYAGPSRAALVGTMMHDVVQSAIQALAEGKVDEPPKVGPHRPAPVKRVSAQLPSQMQYVQAHDSEFLLFQETDKRAVVPVEGAGSSTSAIWNHMMRRIPEVVSENVVNLSEVGMTQREAENELRGSAGQLAATLSRHFRYNSNTSSSSMSATPPASIEGLMDIEESIWVPRYGLKGFIDATVLIRQLPKGAQQASTASDRSTGALGLAALEFKSGKQHHSHRAQLGTYGLLLQSRYGMEPAGGLLWYSRAVDMEFDSMNVRDVAGLMMTRNKLAAYKERGGAWELPPPIRKEHRCRNCFSLSLCTVVHRTLEGGTAESFGLDVFNSLTAHIDDKDAAFLKTWLELLELERAEAKKKHPQENIWALDPPPHTRPVQHVAASAVTACTQPAPTRIYSAAGAPEADRENMCPNSQPSQTVSPDPDLGTGQGERKGVSQAAQPQPLSAPPRAVSPSTGTSPSTEELVDRTAHAAIINHESLSVSNLQKPEEPKAVNTHVKHALQGRCIGHLQLQSYLGQQENTSLYPHKYTFTQCLASSSTPCLTRCTGVLGATGATDQGRVELVPLSSQGFSAGDCGIMSLQGRHVAVNRAQVESVTETVLTVCMRSRLSLAFEQGSTGTGLECAPRTTIEATCCSSMATSSCTQDAATHSSMCLWRIDKDEPETAFQIAVSGVLELVVLMSQHTTRLRRLLVHFERPMKEAKANYDAEVPPDVDHVEAMVEFEKQQTLPQTMPLVAGPRAQHAHHPVHSFSAPAAFHPGQMGYQSATRFQDPAFNAGHHHLVHCSNSTQSVLQRPLSAPGVHAAYGVARGPVSLKNSAPAQLQHSGHVRGPQPQHLSSSGVGCGSNMMSQSQMHAATSQRPAWSSQSAPLAHSQQAHFQHQQQRLPMGTQPWHAHRRSLSVSTPAVGSHATLQHVQQGCRSSQQGYISSQQPATFMCPSQPALQRSTCAAQFMGSWHQGCASLGPSGDKVSAMATGNIASQGYPGPRSHSTAGSCVQTNLCATSAHTSINQPRSQSAPPQQRPSDQVQASKPLQTSVSQSAGPGSSLGPQTVSQRPSVSQPDKNRQAVLHPAEPAGRGLTEEQQAVVDRVLDWNDYVLVMGLPGAGKTTTIAAIVQRLVEEGRSVLLSAYTNSALDNMLLKVVSKGQTQLLRLGRTSSVHPDVKPYLPRVPAGNDPAAAIALRKHIRDVPVVGVTCLSVARSPILRSRLFDVCILDEASQVTLPASLGPLLRCRTFVLVGDHLQLSPLVLSSKAQEGGLGVSLFETLCKQRPEAQVVLRTQHRMCGPIMDLNNEITYSSTLRAASAQVADARLSLPRLSNLPDSAPKWLCAASSAEPTLVWLDTCNLPDARDRKRLSGFCNHTEVALCKAVVDMLLRLGVSASDIGVTSPYVQQVVSLQQALQQAFQAGHNKQQDENEACKVSTQTAAGTEQKCTARTAVMTIDRFQGQEKAAMVVSLVRSNVDRLTGDLLQDSRRINVALTRAQHKVVIVGDSSTVSQVPLLKKVFDTISRLGTVFQLNIEALQGVL